MVESGISEVKVSLLKDFCIQILERLGLSTEHAEITVDYMMTCELRGVSSHGVRLLSMYYDRLRKGLTNAHPDIKVIQETDTTAIIDGNNGLGQVVGTKAMELCIQKAKKSGIALVGAKGSNHFGAASYYAMMALKHDMIGYAVTGAYGGYQAPWGGRMGLMGNDPFSVAIPTEEEFPIVLDIALSVSARSKIAETVAAGKLIPKGWAFNKMGEPTQDPEAALGEGGLQVPLGFPHAAYKGYGMALINGILCSCLTGAKYDSEVKNINGIWDIGHLMGAIDIERFVGIDKFKNRVDKIIREMRNCPKAKNFNRIYVPGEIEGEKMKERLGKGSVPIMNDTLDYLKELGKTLGIELNF